MLIWILSSKFPLHCKFWYWKTTFCCSARAATLPQLALERERKAKLSKRNWFFQKKNILTLLFPAFVDKVRDDVDGDREDDRGVLLVADGAQGLGFQKLHFFVGNGGGKIISFLLSAYLQVPQLQGCA